MIMTKPAAMPAAALALAITALATGALADDRAAVEAFYTRILTASDTVDPALAAQTVISGDWKSYGDYTGLAGTRDQFVGMMTGFHKLIPDLTWKVEDIVQSGDTFVVRGRASGTPQGPLFGVDGKGKSFDIMSIDIHRVQDGRIVESYHVEDWAGALRQLSAK